MNSFARFSRNARLSVLSLIFVCSFANAQVVPTPDHVVICIFENFGYDDIVGSSAAPYINSLINDPYAAVFTESYALTHPSQPNYLMLFSGDNQGVTNDSWPSGRPFSTPNLGAELISKGHSYRSYAEDLPYNGSTSMSSGNYLARHNVGVYWQGNYPNQISSYCNRMFTNFPDSTNYNSLPTVSFVVANRINDMHDGTPPASITTGDNWLANNLDHYIQWCKTNNSLFILTWDEDDNAGGNNQILTMFVGQMVNHGSYNEQITHYNILRTIEDMYSLSYLGASATAVPITDCWINSTTGIASENNADKNSVQVFPNPFRNQTVVKTAQILHSAELKIYNTDGKEVKNIKNVNGTEISINLEELSKGIYFFSILQKNNIISSGRFTVQ